MSETTPVETGDRDAFLARIRSRQATPSTPGPHPPPPPSDIVPALVYRDLVGVDETDASALLEVFTTALREAEATVEVVEGAVPLGSLRVLVERHGIASAVVSAEPAARALADPLRQLGVAVTDFTPAAAAVVDLAVTSATHAIAATGSVVVDSATAGGRAVGILSSVHLCVLPVGALVASHADVLRAQRRPMPSYRLVVTGPSRTGDIEQLLTLGAHGPVALHVVVIR